MQEETQSNAGGRSLKSSKIVGPTHYFRVFKIEYKYWCSALVAEICAGPHNRLLQRQHCRSLCLQSEGHEHIANMASALGQTFLDF